MSDKPPRGGPPKDDEANRLGRRVRRYAQVGAGVGGIAARAAGGRLFGVNTFNDRTARELKSALGGLKGPIMKVAQMIATIPDAVPAEFAAELAELQSAAPPMGWPFVKRRMRAELGPGWEARFRRFEREAAAAASLGQVHRATALDGTLLAVKLQYPDMQSAVDADLRQLGLIFSIHRRMDSAIDTREMYAEIGERLREELDYEREAAHMRLYAHIFAGDARVAVPDVHADLSTKRLLTMSWLDGRPLLDFRDHEMEVRNAIAETMFAAWWTPFSRFGVIHGDPHLGNYTVRPDFGINLLDYGCIRVFPPGFVAGVVELYRALETNDRDRAAAAYENWGFRNLSTELIDTLNVWARFIYAPMLDDRVRSVADGIRPGEYGRKEAFAVHKRLRELGPVTPPREFVFMDRAAIGLGSVFLHLGAELNFHRLFNAAIEAFDTAALDKRQSAALKKAGVPLAA
ncbi:AarF/ABC1/UbiB kinase family protein [Parvibaculum sp.]|uniref:ABC1 kinase family protein n=1 Tax=Parvibaculum sp. TaxID=2024848 RepID=UPI001DF4A50B|nr:AarF/ABC1/UbiB kinase family protein [Parvibaculum sp.]MBX3489056.1 AarF/ABC1/UbiB kinase family protein [Parvibaculum sp.]MCW5727075.1 AarF/ABC1/UbiB kinase family protein [Parvibaculum sp.]